MKTNSSFLWSGSEYTGFSAVIRSAMPQVNQDGRCKMGAEVERQAKVSRDPEDEQKVNGILAASNLSH